MANNTIIQTFSQSTFENSCDQLSKIDKLLSTVIDQYGYPPMWTRPNSFESMVHIILEQQVSLASALATLKMLQAKTNTIEPESILRLSDEEMRACYVSRQKMGYIRGLAEAILSGKIQLTKLEELTDDEVRAQLIELKGIGHWTIDIYLIFVLHRTDIFPIGDLAAVNALKQLKDLPASATREDILKVTYSWQPY